MAREFLDVLWYNKLDAVCLGVEPGNLENFHVIPEDILCHLVGTNVDDVDVWILTRGKDAAYLGIFFLKKLLHTHPLNLVDRERVDMDFDPFALFDLRPFLFELFHHLLPDEHILSVLFLYHFFLPFLS